MHLNSDLCLLYDNNFDSTAIEVFYFPFGFDRPEVYDENGERIYAENTGAIWNFRLNNPIRHKGSYLNAKNRNCCAWSKPKNYYDNTDWFDREKDSYEWCGLEFTDRRKAIKNQK